MRTFDPRGDRRTTEPTDRVEENHMRKLLDRLVAFLVRRTTDKTMKRFTDEINKF